VSEFSSNAVAYHVGILGIFIGSIVFYKTVRVYPPDIEEAIGHGVLLSPGPMERIDLRRIMGDLYRKVSNEEPPRPAFLSGQGSNNQ